MYLFPIAVLFKIFLVALVILCCPVLFVLAVVLVALVFAAIAVAVSGGALLYANCCLPSTGCRLLPSLPMMTLLGTIAGLPHWYSIRELFVYHLAPAIPLVTNGNRFEMVVTDFMDIGCGHYGYQSFCSWLATASAWAAIALTKPHSIKKDNIYSFYSKCTE